MNFSSIKQFQDFTKNIFSTNGISNIRFGNRGKVLRTPILYYSCFVEVGIIEDSSILEQILKDLFEKDVCKQIEEIEVEDGFSPHTEISITTFEAKVRINWST